MSELPLSPLNAQFHTGDAEFQDYAGIELVSTYNEPQVEYAAVRKGAGIFDAAQRGIVELTGKDRHTFLNNLITNQVYDKAAKAPLANGKGVYAFLLNAKTGRIEADFNVIEQGDRLLLEMDARLTAAVATGLEKYRFSEQVKITNRTGAFHMIDLHGITVAELLGPSLSALGPMDSTVMSREEIDAIVFREDALGVPGFRFILPVESTVAFWNGLIQEFGQPYDCTKVRLRPFGWAVYNTARIEAGRALFGIDFDPTMVPAETTEFSRAISLTKGCYPGQEIVARMHARQQVARKIVGLRFAEDALPIAGSPVFDDAQNQVGGVTSSTVSPILSNACLALAIVKKQFMQPGTVVNVPAEGSMRKATVVALPFVTINA